MRRPGPPTAAQLSVRRSPRHGFDDASRAVRANILAECLGSTMATRMPRTNPQRLQLPRLRSPSRRTGVDAPSWASSWAWWSSGQWCPILIVVDAAEHVHDGANQITAVHRSLSADQLLSGALAAPLESAESNFASANSLLSSPVLWPIDVLPVLGRQLRSVQDLSKAADQVSSTGVTVVHQSRDLLNLPHTEGPRTHRCPQATRPSRLDHARHSERDQPRTLPGAARTAGPPTFEVRFRAQPGPDHAGPHLRRRRRGGHHSGRTAELSLARREQRGDAVWVRHVPRSGQHRHQRRRHASGRDAADLVSRAAPGGRPRGRRSGSALGVLPAGGRLAQPRPDAAVRRERRPGLSDVEGQDRASRSTASWRSTSPASRSS